MTVTRNGQIGADGTGSGLHRAEDLSDLLDAVQQLIIPFVQDADTAAAQKSTGQPYKTPDGQSRNTLVDYHGPADLAAKLKMVLPDEGQGKDGLLDGIAKVLRFSVNTWDQGFMDKLYASNTPVGVISDLVLSVLNTNLHVYQVSPALSIIEKNTARSLSNLFGFTGPMAGGISCQGGSASNLTSLVVARNTLYPESKSSGSGKHDFIVFTSAHGHYSVEKSAMICGIGAENVWPVSVDDEGCMRADSLRELASRARAENKTPLYVNATAGTTVRGSFEPFEDISKICKEFGMWMHIDASWGGPVVFSKQQRWKLRGSHLADSLTVNPHKMMNVPATCSFLLGPDMRIFRKANSTKAGYLFHGSPDEETWDLADLTLQCGRRGDSLKLALAWLYYGAQGFERQIDHAFEMATLLSKRLRATGEFRMLSSDEPPCLQVCFYHAPQGVLSGDAKANTLRTSTIVRKLVHRGYMIDYAPGEVGSFVRVVVNVQTLPGTVEGLAKALQEVAIEAQSEGH